MVAKSAIIMSGTNTLINPILVRETVQKVERCMARLQELQFTVTGGTKIISGVRLSPRSSTGYFRTSLRCKQESLRMKNVASQRSPIFKLRERAEAREWRTMSLPAMLLNETVAEIVQASKLVSKLAAKSTNIDPGTPETSSSRRKPLSENNELRARRAKEKQPLSQTRRSDLSSPVLRRARSRIIFKAPSPLTKKEAPNYPIPRPTVSVKRISPKNRPWTKPAVLFPNPLFLSTSPTRTHQKRFYKTRSPIIARTPQPPHKFLIKSPRTTLGSHLKSKKAVPELSASPIITRNGSASKPRRSSFSPSKFANRLVSPLKGRLSFNKVGGGGLITGLKQKQKQKQKQKPGCSSAVNVPSIRSKRGL